MLRVSDLVKGVNQRILPVGLKCNVELGHCPGGCISQTLLVGWNVVPGVHNPHLMILIPTYGGCREVGEYHSN